MIPLPLITALVAAIVAGAGAWTYQEARYGKQLSDIHAAHSLALAEATASAMAETVRLQKAKDDAERKAQVRIAAVRRDAAAATTALGLLHEAADTAIRSANDSHSACQSVAATSTELLGKCSTEYADVARHADEWASEALTLREAWPK
jgi:hypothetical protein